MMYRAIKNTGRAQIGKPWLVIGGDYKGGFYGVAKPKWETAIQVASYLTSGWLTCCAPCLTAHGRAIWTRWLP